VSACEDSSRKGLIAGAVDYLLKPVHPRYLRGVIEQLRQTPSKSDGATRPEDGSHDEEFALRTEF
jgi:DNA-binding response OmpR family regulator